MTTTRQQPKGSKAEGWLMWDGGNGLTYKLVEEDGKWELLAIDTRTNVRRREHELPTEGFYPAWMGMAWHTADGDAQDLLNDFQATPDNCTL